MECDHGSRIQPQCPRVFREIGQCVLRVEESNHCHPGCHIHGVNIADVNEWINRGWSNWRRLSGRVLDDGPREGTSLTAGGRGAGSRVQFGAEEKYPLVREFELE